MILPQPKRLELLPGRFKPAAPWEGDVASPPSWLKRLPDDPALGREGYVLELRPGSASLRAGAAPGAFYGLQSLRQLCRQAAPDGSLASVRVEDRPDLPLRGVSLDLSRGRVPELETLFETIDALAELKVNQLQLYTEHTFAFKAHPEIGKGCGPLTAEDVRRLDDYCAARFIELVPSLASLGHLSKVLALPPYRHLAEDEGEKRYQKQGLDPKEIELFDAGWTLAPGREESYAFLDSLYREYLPLFRSKRFNACCDEPYDLGWGRSFEAVRDLGYEEVFARHVERLKTLALRQGKTQTAIWSDPLHAHPKLKDRLPKDVVIQDWMYGDDSKFEQINSLTAAGFEAVAATSTNSWVQLFPRLPMGLANIDLFSAEAGRAGVRGLINTVWGDRGHYNPPELEWHGLARGAERAWNLQAPAKDFTWRFSAIFLAIPEPAFAAAVDELGDLATLLRHGAMHSFWAECLFAHPDDALFQSPAKAFYRAEGGKVVRDDLALDAAFGRKVGEALGRLRPAIQKGYAGGDFRGLGDAWLFSVDSLSLAAAKWGRLAGRAQVRAAEADELRSRTATIRDRFVSLWKARDREAEIGITLERYEHAINGAAGSVEHVICQTEGD